MKKRDVMSTEERLIWLSEILRSEEGAVSDKFKALDMINKMTGDYGGRSEAEASQTVEIDIRLVD